MPCPFLHTIQGAKLHIVLQTAIEFEVLHIIGHIYLTVSAAHINLSTQHDRYVMLISYILVHSVI